MSVFRLIAITLPMTALIACGGGGGTAMTGTPTTMIPGTEGPTTIPPVTTPTIMPPTSSNPQTLPSYLVTDLAVARTNAGGAAPESMTYSDIVSAFRTRATDADTLQFSDITLRGLAGIGNEIDSNCSGTSCTPTVANIGTLTFSLDEIYDSSLIGNVGLEGYNIESQVVMVDGNATLVQGRGAARQSDGTTLTFQSYAGWLDGGVFGTESITVTENTNTANYFANYSFGDTSGTNPTGMGRAVWNGVFVGINRAASGEAGIPAQGDVTVDIDDLSAPDVDVRFSNIILIDRDSRSGGRSFTLSDIPLSDGTFESTNGEIKGSFYGDNHEEVGGVILDINWSGAFGATRQTQ